MKKNFKRLLAFAVTSALTVSTLPSAVFAAKSTTTAVKEIIDWAAEVLPEASWESKIGRLSAYVGSVNDYNDYAWIDINNGVFSIVIDDVAAGTGKSIATKTHGADSSLVDIPTSDGINWGYMGGIYGYGSGDKQTMPEERWGNVNDMSEFLDTGYAVFKVSDVQGDASNAYLAITTVPDIWALGLNPDNYSLPITKEKYPDWNWNQAYATLVSGERLDKYYDIQKGGEQIVAVPFSELVNSPDFKEAYAKSSGNVQYINSYANGTPDLQMFNGMGIARKDSGSDKTFSAKVSAFAICAPKIPTNFAAAQNTDGTVDMTWTPTADTDVSYKIVKKYKGKTEYIDVPASGVYTDEAALLGKAYTYSVIAVDNTYGVKSPESAAVEISAGISEFYEDFNLSETWASTEGAGNNDFQTWPRALAIGPYNGSRFAYKNDWASHGVNGVLNGNGAVRTYYINDIKYNSDQNGSITYRPSDPSEEGYYESEVGEYYGFNGVRYSNRNKVFHDAIDWQGNTIVHHNLKDFSAIGDSGYAIFEIKLESGSQVDGAYLTLAHMEAGIAEWMGESANEPIAVNLIGVPLSNYYDASKQDESGFQKIAVPLTDFDYTKSDTFLKVLDAEGRKEMKNRALNLKEFNGMGLARYDSRSGDLTKPAQPFAYTAKRLALVNVEAPDALDAVADNNGVTLSWNDSMTDDVYQYEITRNGELLALAEDTEYTDTTALPGVNYTYGVRAKSASFDNVYSATSEVSAEIPVSISAKLYKGTGVEKEETEYTADGDMTAEFYSTLGGATAYAAVYGKDGALKQVVRNEITTLGETLSIVLTGCLKSDTVRAFIWNNNQKPLIEAVATFEKPITVLVIGNDYSVDTTAYLSQIAAADGVNMEVTNLYVDGCSIESQWNNYSNHSNVYYKSVNGVDVASGLLMSDVLAEKSWDYITFQQTSGLSGQNASYAKLPDLVEAVHAAVPSAEVLMHETWEYELGHQSNSFTNVYYDDPEIMYTMLHDEYANAAAVAGNIVNADKSAVKVIPVGTAVRNLKLDNQFTATPFNIYRDGAHLSIPEGRYLAAAVWYKAITGNTVTGNEFNPENAISADNMAVIQRIADK